MDNINFKNMLSVKQESVLLKKIKSLSELDFATLMEEIADHAMKNNWSHVVKEAFGISMHEIEEMEYELDKMSEKKDELVDVIEDTIDALNDIETIDDDEQKKIDKVIDNLQWSI